MNRARADLPAPDFARCAAAFQAELDYVYRTLRRFGIPHADAEDLSQDVFAVMCRRWADYEPERPLRPWLAGIAFHLARDHMRKKSQRELATEDVELVDAGPLPDEQLALARVRALALRALARLPDVHREIFIRHEIDGSSVRQIARETQIPLFTVYSRLRRARLRFNKELAQLQRPLAPPARALALTPAALLEVERVVPRAPASLHRKIAQRVPELGLGWRASPPARGTSPGARLPRRSLAPALAAVLGALVLGLVMLGHSASRPDRPDKAPALAAAPGRSTAAPRPTPARLPPRLLRLAPAAASDDASEVEPRRRQLVGQWRFEDGAGAIARDASGNGRDCVLRDFHRNNAPEGPWVDGAVGGGLDLGARGWLECPMPESRSGVPIELSVAVWVKPARWQSQQNAIVARLIGHRDREHHFFFDLQAQHARLHSSSWVGWTTHTTGVGRGEFSHVAFVHAGRVSKLYVNGVMVKRRDGHRARGEGVVRTNMTVGAARYLVGSERVGSHFEGVLDELMVYDRALDDTEVAALFAARPPGTTLAPPGLAQR